MRAIKTTFLIAAFLGFFTIEGLIMSHAANAADTVKLKLAVGFPKTDSFSVNISEWLKLVKEKTQGRVEITPFFAGSLVPLPEIMDAVRAGSADIGCIVASFTTGKIPGVAAFEGNGSCPSDTAKYHEMLDKVEPVVTEMFSEQGLVYLYMQPAYGINLSAKSKFMEKISDFKGLKVRHAGRWGQRQFQKGGVNTVVIPPGDVYQALQTGVVDAAMGTNSFSVQFKWYEVAPYVTSFNMIGNMNFMIANPSAWKKISAADREIISEVSKQIGRKAAADLEKSQLAAVKKLESQGAKVLSWDESKKAEFLKATAPVWEEIKKASGPFGSQLVDIMNEYRQ